MVTIKNINSDIIIDMVIHENIGINIDIFFKFFYLLSMLSALDKHGRLCYNNNGQNFVHTSKWRTVQLRQPPNKQFCCKGVFLLASREARELITCPLTEYATPGLGRIHNCFCFLHKYHSILLHPILCSPFPSPAGI